MQVDSQGYDTKYCYPESNVLKNKLDIRNPKELNEKERVISFSRILVLGNEPIKGNLDLKHLQGIHKYIFGDIYDWAGNIRTVDIAKSNLFCRVQHIDYLAGDIFGKLQHEKYLIGCQEERIASRLAYYFGEINALHPFREGNGRSQREFIRELAAVSGYELNYKGITEKEMLQASIETFDLKYDKMEQLLKENIRRLPYKEHQRQYESIATKSGALAKTCKEYFQYINRIKTDIKKTGFKPTDEAVRKMEKLHQKAHKELTVKDVHNLIKGNAEIADADKGLMNDIKAAGNEFAKQEMKMKMNQIDLTHR